jgi:hypothetical protein
MKTTRKIKIMKNQKLISIKKMAAIAVFAVGLFAGGARAQLLKSVCPDLNKEPCATAKKMIISSQVIVTDDEPKGDEWTYMAEAFLQGTHNGVPGEQKFKDGLSLKDAVDYWKYYEASPLTGDGNRQKIITNAFNEVFGAMPLITQSKIYIEQIKQKKAWYTTIVLDEQKNLNSNSELRKQTVNRVYSFAMGRSAKAEELDYWMRRKDDFRQMFTAARVYLYTPAGAADLRDVVRRALNFVNKMPPSEEQINTAIEKYKAGKKVHREMLGEKLPFDF